MNQPTLFDAPPIAGSTKLARACSRSGARAVVDVWTEKQSALLQVLENGGGLTRVELSVILGWPISSVCSVLDSVRDQIQSAGVDVVTWPDGRTTMRERFVVRQNR